MDLAGTWPVGERAVEPAVNQAVGTGIGQSEEGSCPNTTNDISVMPLRLQARDKKRPGCLFPGNPAISFMITETRGFPSPPHGEFGL